MLTYIHHQFRSRFLYMLPNRTQVIANLLITLFTTSTVVFYVHNAMTRGCCCNAAVTFCIHVTYHNACFLFGNPLSPNPISPKHAIFDSIPHSCRSIFYHIDMFTKNHRLNVVIISASLPFKISLIRVSIVHSLSSRLIVGVLFPVNTFQESSESTLLKLL